jgi:4,5:9,10-diseco-3-hydroxy-5,9,17-trioxoandrosta-1(10),2-diene-4-oate hydrolase
VLFLQGSGPGASGWSNFQFNVDAFTEAGYRVLVPDLPGFGFSSKPTDVEYHLDYFCASMFGLLDHLHIARCAVVGNSLGGAIALGMALEKPERISALILMAPGGLEEREAYFAMPAMSLMTQVFSGGVNRDSLAEFVRTGLVFDGSKVSETLMDQRWEIYQLQNDQVMKSMVVPNMSGRLGELTCPVLVFWGANEKMMPESGFRTLADNIDDVRLVMVSRCGHWVMLEHPRLFNRTSLDFLSGASRDTGAA